MALTKAQVTYVTTVVANGVPGGYTSELQNFNNQNDLAEALLANPGVNPYADNLSNADFAQMFVDNLLGSSATNTQAQSVYNDLQSGASRAEAMLNFAGQLQLEGNQAFASKLDIANSFAGNNTDIETLKDVVAKADSAYNLFFDTDTVNNNTGNDTDTSVATDQINAVGKYHIDRGTSTISKDYTFHLDNQIGEQELYNGLFLSPILERQAAQSTNSQIFVELLDLRAEADGVDPLERLPADGFGFTLNGDLIRVVSPEIDAANTYPELQAAIINRLQELANGENLPDDANPEAYAKLSGFTVELGNTFTVTNQDGVDVSGTQVVLTDTNGADLVKAGFSNAGGIINNPGYTQYAELLDEAPQQIQQLITTNLDADNVGYGSQGASVNLAGQSASDKGVEEIKLSANDGVWFTRLESTKETAHLERIEVQAGSSDYLRIGTQVANAQHVTSLVTEDFRKAGLIDVREFIANNADSTAVNSYISDNVVDRDYNLADTQGNPVADNINTTYSLTAGDDVLNLAIHEEVLEAVDTEVSVSTGAGNDIVTVMAVSGLDANGNVIMSGNGNWLANQQLNNNISIATGAGNDIITTPGGGNANINAGAGDDLVRTDNTGDKAIFVFNNATTNINDLLSNNDVDLTNGANGGNDGVNSAVQQTYNMFKATVQVNFQGYESQVVNIEYNANTYTTSALQINQAIKAAINNDPVLSKMIAAHDNNANALGIESLVDGVMTTDDLDITIRGPLANGSTATNGEQVLASDDLTNANQATGNAGTYTVANMNTVAGAANTAYDTEFATNAEALITGAEATQGVAGSAGTAAVYNIDLAGAATTNGGTDTLTIDTGSGTPVTLYTDNNDGTADTDVDIANAVAGASTITIDGVTYNVTQPGGAGTTALTLTAQTAANETDNIVIAATASATAPTTASVAPATDGVAAVAAQAEVQNLDFSSVTLADDEAVTFNVDGTNFVFTNESGGSLTGAALVDEIVNGTGGSTALAVTNYTAADATGGVLSLTQDAGNESDIQAITVTSGAGTSVPTLTGSDSTHESDNVINLGTGLDVAELGTGEFSNDTVLLSDYNLGTKYIQNFSTGTGSDHDLLDFTNYLTSTDGNGVIQDRTVVASGTTTLSANSVKTIDFTASGDETFANLTAQELKDALNGTGTDSDFGNLTSGTASSATLAAGDGTDNYVVLVQNGANVGEYKAFHLTATEGSTGDFATAQLIGTLDFGTDTAGSTTSALDGLVDANLA